MAAPPSKRPKLELSEVIKVVVGHESNQKEYSIHKTVIGETSKCAKTALSREWKETHEQRILLPNVCHTNFETYSHWLYTREILPADNAVTLNTTINLYILGDYLEDLPLCQATLHHFVYERYRTGFIPDALTVRHAFENTPDRSPLRFVITELWLSTSMKNAASCLQNNKSFPRDFVADIFAEFADGMVYGRGGIL